MIFNDTTYGISLEIDDKIIGTISELCLDSYPNESGGFLVGYYSEDKLKAIVTETIIPVSYSAGPVSFQRNTDGMEPIWDKLYEDGLVYLGEWHSHPNGNASYSNTDKQALTNIAVSDSVKITHPIMLILGFTKTKVKEIKAYYYKDTEIIRYE